MSYLPIPLGVRRLSDTKGAAAKSRIPSKAQTEKTLWRDAFACRCCGFESKKFQRVVPMNDIVPDAKDGEFVTVCTMCELTASLDRAGLAASGFLIWLPELTQAELNNVVRALYVARASDDALAKAATRALEVLTSRRAEAKKRLGTDDPLILATALYEQLDDRAYAARTEKLEGIRFLPLDRYLVQQRSGKDANVFPQMLAFWTSPEGPFSKIPVSEWTKLFSDVMGKVEEAPKEETEVETK